MITLARYILYLTIAIIPISCHQHKTGIHELQSLYYKNRTSSLLEKITVLNGIDILLEKKLHFIQSKKIALITNHSGIDRNGIPNYKRLMETNNVELKVIFSPEHGLFGEVSDGQKINYDKLNNLPKIISLYGETRKPTAEMLSDINLIIYDIQMMCTYYLYIGIPIIP